MALDAIERGAQQRVSEFSHVLDLLSRRSTTRVVEIGVHDAGALWAWGQLTEARPESQVFGIDLTDVNVRPDNVEDLSPRDVEIFYGDSASDDLVDRVTSRLSGPIDFLFIDGDHTWEGVLRDYLAWRPHVATSGVVGFHDISFACREGWEKVQPHVKNNLAIEVRELSDDVQRMGIGLLL